ncbi:MAG: histidine phosphatase family protein [Candidatus Sulfotelmatobacter sp.]
MTSMILIRHGETDLAGMFCGHSNPDLNAAGEKQLASLAAELAALGIRRIYSSDLQRASRTAAAIGLRTGIAVEFRTGLREIHFGVWEGLTWEEIERRYPKEAELWLNRFPAYSPPGGEPYADFVARVEAEFHLLLRETTDLTKASDLTQAVVTHRGVMQYALTRFFGFSDAEAWRRTERHGVAIVATQVQNYRDCLGDRKPEHAIG